MNRGRPTKAPNRIFIRIPSRRGARIPIVGGETPSEPAGEDACGTVTVWSPWEVRRKYPGQPGYFIL